mgnify:CR=1 FL=1
MLHREIPYALGLLNARNHPPAARACGQECADGVWVADRGGKPDAARVDARDATEAFDERNRLAATVSAQKRVDLVDYNEAKVAEQMRDGRVLME